MEGAKVDVTSLAAAAPVSGFRSLEQSRHAVIVGMKTVFAFPETGCSEREVASRMLSS